MKTTPLVLLVVMLVGCQKNNEPCLTADDIPKIVQATKPAALPVPEFTFTNSISILMDNTGALCRMGDCSERLAGRAQLTPHIVKECKHIEEIPICTKKPKPNWYVLRKENSHSMPTVTLVCKKCKQIFDIELGKLFELAGKAACTICGKTSVYNFSDVKQVPPKF